MPLFDYECECGNTFEAILSIKDCDNPQRCKCGKVAKKVIALGHGGIFRTGDSLPWVRSLSNILTDADNPNHQMETVQDLRNYYKTHPEIAPVESHPALPSSIGDVDKPDPVQMKRERSKRANNLLRNMRSVEINTAGQATA